MSVKTLNETSRTDWELFDALSDEEIETDDIPPLGDDFFENATLRLPQNHSTVTLELDSDVLKWFQEQGNEFGKKINMVLRVYMESRKRKVH